MNRHPGSADLRLHRGWWTRTNIVAIFLFARLNTLCWAETISVKVLNHEGAAISNFYYDANALWPFHWSDQVYICSDSDTAVVSGAPLPKLGPNSSAWVPHSYVKQRPPIYLECFQDGTMVASSGYSGPTSLTVPGPGMYRVRCTTTFQRDEVEIQPLVGSIIDSTTGLFTIPPFLGIPNGSEAFTVFKIEVRSLGDKYAYAIYKRYTYVFSVETWANVSPGQTNKALLVLPNDPDTWSTSSRPSANTTLDTFLQTAVISVAQGQIEAKLDAMFKSTFLRKLPLEGSFLASQGANIIFATLSPEQDLTLDSAVKTAIGWTANKLAIASITSAIGGSLPAVGEIAIGVVVDEALDDYYRKIKWENFLEDIGDAYGDDLVVAYSGTPVINTILVNNRGCPLESVFMGTLHTSSGLVTEYRDRGVVPALQTGDSAKFAYLTEPSDCDDCQAAILATPPILTMEGHVQIAIPLSKVRTGSTLDVSGALKVELQPSAAVAAGAQWRVDSGSWQANKAEVNLLSGLHTVEYRGIPGYATPAPEIIRVQTGQLLTIQHSYGDAVSGTKEFHSVADTWVWEARPAEPQDSWTVMFVAAEPLGDRRNALIRFDLSSIPSGSILTSVELNLYAPTVNNSNRTPSYLASCSASWSEKTTWTTMPAAGAGLAAKKTITQPGWQTWSSTDFSELKSKVQSWVDNPSKNFGFFFGMDPDLGVIAFSTRETLTSENQPRLLVAYSAPVDTEGDSISNVSAKTSASGSSITPSRWQRDDSPYFYWNAPHSTSPIVGYSYAIDVGPPNSVTFTSPAIQLPSGGISESKHTFKVKSLDTAGNWGPTASFEIWIDRTPPVNLSFNISPSAETTSSVVALTNISAYDASSGVKEMRFSNDGVSWTTWEAIANMRTNWDLTQYGGLGDYGLKHVYLQARDAAGNVSTTIQNSVELKDPGSVPAIQQGLAAYFPFESNANDASGHDHNGVVQGAVLTTGRGGRGNSAFQFDGAGGRIEIAASPDFEFTGNFTVCAWVRRAEPGRSMGDPILSKDSQTGSSTHFLFRFDASTSPPTDKLAFWWWNNGWHGGAAGPPVRDTAWHHVSAVRNGTQILLFLDGAWIGSLDVTAPLLAKGEYLQIGQGHGIPPNQTFFKGTIDDLRIYHRELSNSEVAQLAFRINADAFTTGVTRFFQLRTAGLPNKTFVIESTSDLSHWLPISTNTADGAGLMEFSEPSNVRQLFYRLFER